MKRIATPLDTNELCSYGCGCIAKFKNGSGKLMCLERSNSCPAIRAKNSNGLKNSGRDYKTDYQNLPQESKDKMAWARGIIKPPSFSLNGVGNHKGFLINERGHRCENCNNHEWCGKPIAIELEHIDGDNRNNTKENLKLLCPNCHAQTATYRGKNINKGKKKVSDEELLHALSITKNNRAALLYVGLTPKGGNYERCNRLRGIGGTADTSGLSPDAKA